MMVKTNQSCTRIKISRPDPTRPTKAVIRPDLTRQFMRLFGPDPTRSPIITGKVAKLITS